MRHYKQVTLHVILMALRVCGWTVDLGPLAKRMKTSVAELVPHCKELGCKILKGTGGGKAAGPGRSFPSLYKRPQLCCVPEITGRYPNSTPQR